MAAFTEENVEAVIAHCQANIAALADSLGRCFGRSYRIEAGESGVWSPMDVPPEFQSPGIVDLVQVGAQGMAVLLSEALSPPDWSANLDDDKNARLETLTREWSANLAPAEFETEKHRSLVVPNLAEAVNEMVPADWAVQLELIVFDANETTEAPIGKLLVVWPLASPNFDRESGEPAPVSNQSDTAPTMTETPTPVTAVDPLSRLRQLPVQISVRLAEKKISLSQLLSITPGMLIMFNKSCEDLLDLYVSNSCYCRGEAVKIGENFGLKVNQVGVIEEAPQRIIEA